MADAWELEGEGSGWSPRCSRQLNDCELPEVESFFRKLHSIIIKKEMEDSLRWNESKCDKVSIRSLYYSLSRSHICPFQLALYGGLGHLWRLAFLPRKRLRVEPLLSTNWKGGDGVLPSRCYLCKDAEEMMDHLLLHCSKARMVWQLIFSLFKVE